MRPQINSKAIALILTIIRLILTDSTNISYVSANDYDFQNTTLVCNQSTNCVVSCNHDYSCYNAVITASAVQHLDLNCYYESGCENIYISGDIASVNIRCVGRRSCYNGVFNLSRAIKVEIECKPSYSNGEHYACSYAKIYLLQSQVVDLTCKDYWSCREMNVYLPLAPNSTTTIACERSLACWRAIIYGSYGSIDIACTGGFSCSGMVVYAVSAEDIHLLCGYRYSDLSISTMAYMSCKDLSINAFNSNSMNVLCFQGCSDMYINATNVGAISVQSLSLNALTNSHFFIENVYTVNIICATPELSVDGACSNMHLYYNGIPHQQEAILNCQGYGCAGNGSIYLYSITGLSVWDIAVNECNHSLIRAEWTKDFVLHCGSVLNETYNLEINNTCGNNTNCCNESHRIAVVDNIATCDNTIFTTAMPTTRPTLYPTGQPTMEPTSPTKIPTVQPSIPPTQLPTKSPSSNPSIYPTLIPTLYPSQNPTLTPTRIPTMPTNVPTYNPTDEPTFLPTNLPTAPTFEPTFIPTAVPSMPTIEPTYYPVTNTAASTLIQLDVESDESGVEEHSDDQTVGIVVGILIAFFCLYCLSLCMRMPLHGTHGCWLCDCEVYCVNGCES